MNIYFNALETPVTLPMPGNQGTRLIASGESFYGPAFYDKFVTQGLLAKVSGEFAMHKGFVGTSDIEANSNVPDSQAPHRYKTNSSPSTIKSEGETKYVVHYNADTQVGDPVLVTYYFYTNRVTANKPTHSVSRYEVLTANWVPPSWAPLPVNFYSLNPVEQRNALLAVQ
jgi:hypothetical protein